ncbi:MAG: hypothetical protein HQK99_02885 [Nitrospirae bacterium]|nr:hypothetical protein [Nitrospirota bacterium]
MSQQNRLAVGSSVPLSVVFPEQQSSKETFLEILANLSRDDALIMCAYINTIVTGSASLKRFDRQKYAVEFLCTETEIQKISDFAKLQGGFEHIAVFFRGQLLELARWIAKHCKNLPGGGESFNSPQFKKYFLQAALISGELWGERICRGLLIEHDNNQWLSATIKSTEESAHATRLRYLLTRGWLLNIKYLPSSYPAFSSEFQSATGLTVKQYLVCVTFISSSLTLPEIKNYSFNPQEVAAATTNYQDVFFKYFALESQSSESLKDSLWQDFSQKGYLSLRKRPIINCEGNRSIVIDPIFHNEKITVGPLFHLLSKTTGRKDNDIFSAFGSAFEDYATDILKRIYHVPSPLIQRLFCNVKRQNNKFTVFEIDAVLNYETALVIFEIKASWLREDKILDEMTDNLLNELRKKYGAIPQTNGSHKERPKGVAQLAKIVQAIAKREWLGENNEFENAKLIYPVLLVYNEQMASLLLGRFLNEEFNSLLGHTHSEVNITPLITMTIDDLENLESSIDKFSLRDLLSDYISKVPDCTISLRNFIAQSEYNDKWEKNHELDVKFNELWQQFQSELTQDIEGAALKLPQGGSPP